MTICSDAFSAAFALITIHSIVAQKPEVETVVEMDFEYDTV